VCPVRSVCGLAIATLGETVKGRGPCWGAPSTAQGAYGEGAVRPISYRSGEGPCSRQRGDRPKKASSLYIDRGLINRHIVPLLGNTRAQSLKAADINKFIGDVATGKSAKVEKTDKKCCKSIVRGGLGKDYTRQKKAEPQAYGVKIRLGCCGCPEGVQGSLPGTRALPSRRRSSRSSKASKAHGDE
jgi:hypothetical protein